MAAFHTDYDFTSVESRWQQFWREHRTFSAREDEPGRARPKYYVLDMFPYPSGEGLHIGHPVCYFPTDIIARFKHAQGYNVLHPQGYDAFGLPTEQYALKTGRHPRDTTRDNVERFRAQLQKLGFVYDPDREVNTTDPAYFRWTQWIFLQLFKHGLAYVDEKPVWYCPALGTVLANEEILNTPEGPRSERGQHPVERRQLRQWVLRITAYAEKLLAGLEKLDWPESTKKLQQNWIGRSHGAEVRFSLRGHPGVEFTIFTTRPDTLFGATYVVLAPEHPLLAKLVTPPHRVAVAAYQEQTRVKSDLDRTDLAKDKTGVFTGAHAVNPVNGKPIPVWVADYVLMTYGTGAIMAVPAHDARDFEFAQKFGLEIVPVIARPGADNTPLPYTEPGVMINSGSYDGLDTAECAQAIVSNLASGGYARATVNYKLRDWLFSRQRYWGEPFPILWVSPDNYAKLNDFPNSPLKDFLPKKPIQNGTGPGSLVALPLCEKHLPLRLPEVDSFQPTVPEAGQEVYSPLMRNADWWNIQVNLATGETKSLPYVSGDPAWVPAFRETNTMPQWAGSCWYYLRYLDPRNDHALFDPAREAYWGMPDLYVGGAEHAVLHLLYARFWHLVLHDLGFVRAPEPFPRLFHQGMLLGEDGQKMSKSRGNVVNPDDFLAHYGADVLRLYLMFLGPVEDTKPWNSAGVEGAVRFLRRLVREFLTPDSRPAPKLDAGDDDPATSRLLHESIQKISRDYENLRFNTVVSQLMILLNHLSAQPRYSLATARVYTQLLAPLAPHLAEELWERLGGQPSVADHPWPRPDPAKLVRDTVKVILQVNGKHRGDVSVPAAATREDVLTLAQAHERVAPHLAGKTIAKVVYVPGKILNLVVP